MEKNTVKATAAGISTLPILAVWAAIIIAFPIGIMYLIGRAINFLVTHAPYHI